MWIKTFRFAATIVLAIVLSSSKSEAQTRALSAQEQALILSKSSDVPFELIKTDQEGGSEFLQTPSPDLLRDPSTPIDHLSRRMLATVLHPDNDGVGIAAPQIGVHTNALWVQRFDKPDAPFEFYINTKILWRSDLWRLGPEGCLSIPDFRGDVYRHYAICISYETLEGHSFTEIIEGFTAVIFQHEYDHILGILFPTRIDEQKNWTWKKQEQFFLLEK